MTDRARSIVAQMRRDHEAMDKRRAKADELISQLSDAKRVVLSGGPRTGKSTIAVRAGERYQRKVRHADGLIGKMDWSGQSEEVAKWMTEDGDFIIEGVSAPRALRKLLAMAPDKLRDMTIVHFREPVQTQTDKQRAMSKGVETVWMQIRDELRKRGATVIEREAGEPVERTREEKHAEFNRLAAMGEEPPSMMAAASLEDPADREPEPDEPPVIRNAR